MRERIKNIIFDATGMERTLARLAHEIIERNCGLGDVALVGIRTRGAPMAERLLKKLSKIEGGSEIGIGILDINLYRDDYLTSGKTPVVRGTDIPFEINDRTIVLVDDVLYTGRTVRAAIDALLDYGRPSKIQLAVLIDRGHREMPIQGDFVGQKVVTVPGEQVRVRLSEVDGVDEVVLVETTEEN